MDLDILLKIFLSAVLGGIIGLEREGYRKNAGLRVNLLIAVGSALVTLLSFKLATQWTSADPMRLTAQVITAVGFLGGGIIIKERFSMQGMSAAVSAWTASTIGITVGCGYYMIAFVVTLLIIALLACLNIITSILGKQAEIYPYIITTEDHALVLIEMKRILHDLAIKYSNTRLRKVNEGYEIEIELITSASKNDAFMERIMQIPGVKEITGEHF